MNRRIATLVLLVAGFWLLGGLVAAQAHECPGGDPNGEDCHPTPVYPNWRPSYVPVFGLEDREDEEQRREAQRWRDEWGCDTQFCVWLKLGFSVFDGSPTSVHTGAAGDHSLSEGAHSSQGHGTEEGNHDSHGGALYADVCLGSDQGTSYEGQAGDCEGVQDTQVGVTIMDHNPCGIPEPGQIPIPCSDEYYVIRPFDFEYTQAQMDNTEEELAYDLANPDDYLCGYEAYPSNPPCQQIREMGDAWRASAARHRGPAVLQR